MKVMQACLISEKFVAFSAAAASLLAIPLPTILHSARIFGLTMIGFEVIPWIFIFAVMGRWQLDRVSNPAITGRCCKVIEERCV